LNGNLPAISGITKNEMGESVRVMTGLQRLAVGVSAALLLTLWGAVALAQAPTSGPNAPSASVPLAPPPAASPPAASGITFGFAPLPANPNPNGIVDELKVGGLWHDIGFLGDHTERGADVDLEMLFTSPDLLSIIGSPRPHIGADINTAGDTSDAFAGLTWGISLIQNLFRPGDAVYITGSLGGAYQDGYIDKAPDKRKKMGSPVLFRESAELGYQVTPTISIGAILDHISNANLAQHNAGITNAGARLGFKF
jgi:lipid A 3-O-deacylase